MLLESMAATIVFSLIGLMVVTVAHDWHFVPHPSTGTRLLSSELNIIFLPLNSSSLGARHLLTDSRMPKSPRLMLAGGFNCVAMLVNKICGHNYINIVQHAQYGQQQVYQLLCKPIACERGSAPRRGQNKAQTWRVGGRDNLPREQGQAGRRDSPVKPRFCKNSRPGNQGTDGRAPARAGGAQGKIGRGPADCGRAKASQGRHDLQRVA